MRHASKVLPVLIITCVLAFTLSMAAHAGGKAGGTNLPSDNSSPELQRIKGLAGRWTTMTSMFGKKNQRMFTEYQVTAGGSAVLERIFPGTPEEMISVYYDDDHGKLAMTHYCIMRNRPTLKLVRSSSPDTIKMNVAKISGFKSKKEPSMGGVAIHFKDKNHIQQTCSGTGKEHPEPMTLDYTRVR